MHRVGNHFEMDFHDPAARSYQLCQPICSACNLICCSRSLPESCDNLPDNFNQVYMDWSLRKLEGFVAYECKERGAMHILDDAISEAHDDFLRRQSRFNPYLYDADGNVLPFKYMVLGIQAWPRDPS